MEPDYRRFPPPAHYARAKLTPQQRDEIRERRRAGEKTKDIARAYGVSVATVRGIAF